MKEELENKTWYRLYKVIAIFIISVSFFVASFFVRSFSQESSVLEGILGWIVGGSINVLFWSFFFFIVLKKIIVYVLYGRATKVKQAERSESTPSV